MNCSPQRNKIKVIDQYLLSGLLVCGKYGHSLGITSKNTTKAKTKYTSCNYYNRKGKTSGCTPNRLNYDLLEKDVINYLKEIGEEFIKHYDIRNLVEDSVYIYNKDLLELKNNVDAIQIKIDKEISTISSLYNDKMEGHISLEIFKKLSQDHENNLQILNKEKEKLESKSNNLSNERTEMNFTRCRDLVEKYVSMKKPSRTLIKRLINSIVIYDYGTIKEVKINLKFKMISSFTSIIKV